MKKLGKLLQFLYKESKYFEIDLLLKFASDETAEGFLKKNYKNIYDVYIENNKSPNASVYINMINQIKMTGVNIDSLDLSSFDKIKRYLSEISKNKKNKKYNYYFKNIKHPELTQSLISSILHSGISKEDFDFILNQERHNLHQRFIMLDELYKIKDKVALANPEANLEIHTYLNIDDAINAFDAIIETQGTGKNKEKLLKFYKYIWDGKDPDETYKNYKAIESGAKNNSKIIYEDDDQIVVHSWSREAAQYWERPAVIFVQGRAKFNTCTSRVYEEGFGKQNLFDTYAEYDMYQIIQKRALDENNVPKFFVDKDALYTVCFDENNNLVTGHASVDAADTSISGNYFRSIKNYDKLMKVIADNVTGVKISNIGYEEAIKKYGAREVVDTILNKCSSYIFFKTDLWKGDKFPDPENEFDENIGKIEEDYFIVNNDKIYIQDFESIVEFKINNMKSENYYKLGMNEVPNFHQNLDYERFWNYDEEMAEKMDPEMFFEMHIDENSYAGNQIAYEKAVEVSPMYYMESLIHHNLFDDLYSSMALEKVKALDIYEIMELDIAEISDVCEKYFDWADQNGVFPHDKYEDPNLATDQFVKELLIEKIEGADAKEQLYLIRSDQADDYLRKLLEDTEILQESYYKTEKIFYEAIGKNIEDISKEILKEYKLSDLQKGYLTNDIRYIFKFIEEYIESVKLSRDKNEEARVNLEYILNFFLKENGSFELIINKYFSPNLHQWNALMYKFQMIAVYIESLYYDLTNDLDEKQDTEFHNNIEKCINKIKNIFNEKVNLIFLEVGRSLKNEEEIKNFEKTLEFILNSFLNKKKEFMEVIKNLIKNIDINEYAKNLPAGSDLVLSKIDNLIKDLELGVYDIYQNKIKNELTEDNFFGKYVILYPELISYKIDKTSGEDKISKSMKVLLEVDGIIGVQPSPSSSYNKFGKLFNSEEGKLIIKKLLKIVGIEDVKTADREKNYPIYNVLSFMQPKEDASSFFKSTDEDPSLVGMLNQEEPSHRERIDELFPDEFPDTDEVFAGVPDEEEITFDEEEDTEND